MWVLQESNLILEIFSLAYAPAIPKIQESPLSGSNQFYSALQVRCTIIYA